MWGLGDILSIMCNPVTKTQVIRLGNKNLYLLSHLAESPSGSNVLFYRAFSLGIFTKPSMIKKIVRIGLFHAYQSYW